MDKSNLKDFIAYLDDVLYAEHRDQFAVKSSVDILVGFFKKNDFVDSEIAEFMSDISDTIKLENTFDAMSLGYYLGLVMGKFSKKIEVKNYGL